MKIAYGREAFRAYKSKRYTEGEKGRFKQALDQFQNNPAHPGLNFERLGSKEKQNHYSIRASKELRIILAIDSPMGHPNLDSKVMIANMGHHDEMYSWSERQAFHSEIFEGSAPDGKNLSDDRAQSIDQLMSFEEWQLYLHPDQEHHATRTFSQEARIYGGAGTGKTVIGLHRIARIARENPDERMLVTAFHKTLVNGLREKFRGLPNAPTNVDFFSLFQIARRWSGEGNVDAKEVNKAFQVAYRQEIEGSVLTSCTQQYIREEIERVIKGRAASKDAYLATDRFQRIGRLRGFKRREREVCWNCLEAWDTAMAKRGTTSFHNQLKNAMERAEAHDRPVYRSVVVDEGQDITATGMRLVRALVAGKPENPVPKDGLLFLDDKAQQIYPGGFRAEWAGLSFRGRSEPLHTGLRTTRQIAKAAAAVRGQNLVDKSDPGTPTVDPKNYMREECTPCWVQAGKKELLKVREIIGQLTGKMGLEPNQIGVLMHKQKDVDNCIKFLGKKGVAAVNLKNDSSGRNPGQVGVVTLDSSKGLEFSAVLIPRVGKSIFPLTEVDQSSLFRRLGEDKSIQPEQNLDEILDDEAKEKRQLNLDRLYVGMTRARDYLFLISSDEPCREIEASRDHFDWYSISRPLDIA